MKGMLMKPDMIQAVIEDRKTRTSRIEAALKGINRTPDIWESTATLNDRVICFYNRQSLISVRIKPRYHAGETVYIKQAWACDLGHIIYKTGKARRGDDTNLQLIKAEEAEGYDWRSPLFMPEWAARHFITITGVSAERLQEITEEDARAEGISQDYIFKNGLYLEDGYSYRRAYRRLWNSINPKYPWESNPWVFPYTFRRLNE